MNEFRQKNQFCGGGCQLAGAVELLYFHWYSSIANACCFDNFVVLFVKNFYYWKGYIYFIFFRQTLLHNQVCFWSILPVGSSAGVKLWLSYFFLSFFVLLSGVWHFVVRRCLARSVIPPKMVLQKPLSTTFTGLWKNIVYFFSFDHFREIYWKRSIFVCRLVNCVRWRLNFNYRNFVGKSWQ